MRKLFTLTLVLSSLMAATAYADGIERPRRPRAAAVRPAPVLAGGPIDIPVQVGPETVSLNDGFIRAADGGVGAGVSAAAYVGGGSTIIVRGGQATAIAIARASASAVAFGGGMTYRGGHGCR